MHNISDRFTICVSNIPLIFEIWYAWKMVKKEGASFSWFPIPFLPSFSEEKVDTIGQKFIYNSLARQLGNTATAKDTWLECSKRVKLTTSVPFFLYKTCCVVRERKKKTCTNSSNSKGPFLHSLHLWKRGYNNYWLLSIPSILLLTYLCTFIQQESVSFYMLLCYY